MRTRGNKLNGDQGEYIIMKCSCRFHAEAILQKRKSFHQNIIARNRGDLNREVRMIRLGYRRDG